MPGELHTAWNADAGFRLVRWSGTIDTADVPAAQAADPTTAHMPCPGLTDARTARFTSTSRDIAVAVDALPYLRLGDRWAFVVHRTISTEATVIRRYLDMVGEPNLPIVGSVGEALGAVGVERDDFEATKQLLALRWSSDGGAIDLR